jgi:hypothetical protein
MNDSKIDLSSLDPSRDRKCWETRIKFIADRAAERAQRRLTVTGQLLRWSRPMLAVAASVALLGWVSLATFGEQRVTKSVDPAMAITVWALRDEVPSTETVIAALGGSLEQQ